MLYRLNDFIYALGAESDLQIKAEKKGVNEEVCEFDIVTLTREKFRKRNQLDYQLYHNVRTLSNA
jgi:hypothetical protein